MSTIKSSPVIFPILLGLSSLSIMLSSCASQQKNTGTQVGVARMLVDEPIPGVCDNKNVIVVLPIPGNMQIKAQAPKTKDEIVKELNSKVLYLKDSSSYEYKGSVTMIINCKGEMVRCTTDTKTKSTELDSQILAVFAELKKWKPGTFNMKPIDTVEFYSFTIKNGKIVL